MASLWARKMQRLGKWQRESSPKIWAMFTEERCSL